MTRPHLRAWALAAAFLVIAGVVVTATAVFIGNTTRHVGADYTAFASNLVRGQQETAELRDAARAFRDHPGAFHQQALRRTLAMVRSRAGTTRAGLERSPLDPAAYRALLSELDETVARIPSVANQVARAVDDPGIRDDMLNAVLALEDSLAFVYSELHELNQAGAAEQRRLMRTLSLTVIGLAGLLLAIIAGLLWTMHTISGQKARLAELTVTDALTGLPNRRALLQRLDDAATRAARGGTSTSMALIDVDDFKSINDRHGHPVGDDVLCRFASSLRRFSRRSDVTARIGGEEFGILMPDTGAAGALAHCERVRAQIEAMALPVPGGVHRITVSIGVHTAGPGEDSAFDTLYAGADAALYEAKRGGRNRVVAAGDRGSRDAGTSVPSPKFPG